MGNNRKPKGRNKRGKRPGQSTEKSINRCLPGFWMRFNLDDPLGDHDKPVNVQVGHTNPVMQLRLTSDSFWQAMRQVLHHRTMKWSVDIRMEFAKDGKTEFKSRQIVGVGRLSALDDIYQETIELMFTEAGDKNYLDRYVTTHVCQEVLSGQIIKDEDFEDAV